MSQHFRLLTETARQSRSLPMDDLDRDHGGRRCTLFERGTCTQPVRTVSRRWPEHAFFGVMPAYVPRAGRGSAPSSSRSSASNAARGLPVHLATILLLDPETGALQALLDGRFITEARTAAVSAVSARLLARRTRVARDHRVRRPGAQPPRGASRVRTLRTVPGVESEQTHRDAFVEDKTERSLPESDPARNAADRRRGGGGADIVVLVTSSPAPVLENGWVKPGAHVISVGACRPTQREMDPALVARARLFVDSRAAALVESGDVVLGIRKDGSPESTSSPSSGSSCSAAPPGGKATARSPSSSRLAWPSRTWSPPTWSCAGRSKPAAARNSRSDLLVRSRSGRETEGPEEP